MTALNISTDKCFDYFAHRSLEYSYPRLSSVDREKYLNTVKCNLELMTFNVSTVMLTVAVVSAIFAKFAAAVAIGAIALFIRSVVTKELDKNLAVANALEGIPEDGGIRRAVKGTLDAAISFLSGGGIKLPDWYPNKVILFDYPVWKNLLPNEAVVH